MTVYAKSQTRGLGEILPKTVWVSLFLCYFITDEDILYTNCDISGGRWSVKYIILF